MRFIGDIHGRVTPYLELLKNCTESVQVGDFGAGFVTLPDLDKNHRAIRGNHDSPLSMERWANWIPDGTLENGVLYIGGAYSIDWMLRTEGVSWWRDEQCSQEQLQRFVDLAVEAKPEVLVTHDCPRAALPIFPHPTHHYEVTRTRQALDALWEQWKPKLWVFGHHHVTAGAILEGTQFLCLGAMDYVDVDLTNMELTWDFPGCRPYVNRA